MRRQMVASSLVCYSALILATLPEKELLSYLADNYVATIPRQKEEGKLIPVHVKLTTVLYEIIEIVCRKYSNMDYFS